MRRFFTNSKSHNVNDNTSQQTVFPSSSSSSSKISLSKSISEKLRLKLKLKSRSNNNRNDNNHNGYIVNNKNQNHDVDRKTEYRYASINPPPPTKPVIDNIIYTVDEQGQGDEQRDPKLSQDVSYVDKASVQDVISTIYPDSNSNLSSPVSQKQLRFSIGTMERDCRSAAVIGCFPIARQVLDRKHSGDDILLNNSTTTTTTISSTSAATTSSSSAPHLTNNMSHIRAPRLERIAEVTTTIAKTKKVTLQTTAEIATTNDSTRNSNISASTKDTLPTTVLQEKRAQECSNRVDTIRRKNTKAKRKSVERRFNNSSARRRRSIDNLFNSLRKTAAKVVPEQQNDSSTSKSSTSALGSSVSASRQQQTRHAHRIRLEKLVSPFPLGAKTLTRMEWENHLHRRSSDGHTQEHLTLHGHPTITNTKTMRARANTKRSPFKSYQLNRKPSLSEFGYMHSHVPGSNQQEPSVGFHKSLAQLDKNIVT